MNASPALGRTLSILAGLSLLACAGSAIESPDQPGQPAAPAPTTLTALPRPLTTSELKVSAAANQFSFSLFRAVSGAQRDTNVFASPLSASMVLGMTLNGAAGGTFDQMREALAVEGASESEINEGYKSLIALLRGLDAGVDVRIANSIWYRNGFAVNQSFLDAGHNWFDAEVSALDFNSPSAVPTINAWVSKATNGKIPTILDRIEADQMMFLINAIYFKGAWREKFDAAKTKDESFRAASGVQSVRMMHRTGEMSYASTADFEVVDLPYGNSAFTMAVLLPREGKSVETIASTLQSTAWTTVASQLRSAHVDLSLPRFRLEWERVLNADLKSLGMRDAFVPGVADFSRMSPQGRQLFLEFVKQKSYVDVTEEGTEAAAVTVGGITLTSAPLNVVVKVDKPFIFLIRERFSGTILFMGKVVRI